jgi:hypothetical protein
MRQAPPAIKPSLRPSSQHKRRTNAKSCSTSTIVIFITVAFVVVVLVILPSRYLAHSNTDHEHPLLKGGSRGGILMEGLHKVQELSEKWKKGDIENRIDAGSADWANQVLKPPSAGKSESVMATSGGNKRTTDTTAQQGSLPSSTQQQQVTSSVKPVISTAPPVPVAASIPAGNQKQERRRIAYAITITRDGFFQDGAAVLAYSIFSASKHSTDDISLVAFVHPNVTTSRPALQKLGYHVIEAPKPLNVSAIEGPWLREKIDKNGCCGASELIKLNSYRLTQYDRVVHMDADTYLLNVRYHLYYLPLIFIVPATIIVMPTNN